MRFQLPSLLRSVGLPGIVVTSVLLISGGCGRTPSDGPQRFSLSGTVTFDGKPLPVGRIRFSPDSKKGNEGPGALVSVRDGKFRTDSTKGIVGGPMIAEISGSDGVPVTISGESIPDGTPLFESYRIQVELPLKDGQHDFEVPKTAALPNKSP